MASVVELPINNVNELSAVAKFLLEFAGDTKQFAFYAPMGAGKTTFIKVLCKSLGINDQLSSPTYSIVNEYHYDKGKAFHFDLYRLKGISELLDIGIEEYLDSGSYCFFEWPELVEEFLDQKHLKIEIEMEGNNRYLRATKF